MAVRSESFEQRQWNRTFDEVARTIAGELDPPLDNLPMDQKKYDYFARGLGILKRMSPWRDQELEDATIRVLGNLFFHTPKLPKGQTRYREEQKYNKETETGRRVRRGPIYNYPVALAKKGLTLTPEKYPFNRFFVNLFKKRARNEVDREFKTGRFRDIQKYSLTNTGEYEERGPGGAVSPAVLADPSSPKPSARAEENEKLKFLHETVPGQLALVENERDRKILKVFYQMFYLNHAKLWEVGQRLDELSKDDSDYYPAGGGVDKDGNPVPWAKSTLSKYQDNITELMEQYYREEKQKKHPNPLTPEQSKAIFQSRRARGA